MRIRFAAAVFFGLIGSAGTAAWAAAEVQGLVLELNKPGTIQLGISVGRDDGVKAGDTFLVMRKEKRIGTLKITSAEPDRAEATIIKVEEGEALRKGDFVVRQK